jgi:hypothetical protein
MAPRSKLSESRVEALLNALRVGNTRRAACAHAEIDSATFYRWMLADAALRSEVERAEGEAETRFLAQVARAATNGTWQAAAWWLERRHPADFGLRARLDVRVELEAEVRRLAIEAGVDSDTALAEAERLLRGGGQ